MAEISTFMLQFEHLMVGNKPARSASSAMTAHAASSTPQSLDRSISTPRTNHEPVHETLSGLHVSELAQRPITGDDCEPRLHMQKLRAWLERDSARAKYSLRRTMTLLQACAYFPATINARDLFGPGSRWALEMPHRAIRASQQASPMAELRQ